MHEAANKAVTDLLERMDQALPGAYSAILHGSAARDDFVPGHSDINLLLVLDRVDPASLRALGEALKRWREARHPPPVLFSRDELPRCADSFPIEITDMRAGYRVLRGVDLIAALEVRPADLRRALEREFRGKLLRLRQGFANGADDVPALSALARLSIGSVLVLLRSSLTLSGQRTPSEPRAVVGAAAQAMGFDADALLAIADHRADARWQGSAEQFEHYLGAVEAAARYIDELQTGDR
jgi:predicted nucleotidyltransferase